MVRADAGRWEAVVFDLDGTLIDSAADIQTSINTVLGEDALAPLTLPLVTSFIGNGVSHLVKLAYQHRGRSLEVAALIERTGRFSRAYADNPIEQTRPFPGVVGCLRRLRERGVKLGVCTNKPLVLTEKILGGLRLRSFFQVVIGGDSCRTRKPSPEPLLACCEAPEVEPRHCLYVGDSETDVATARAAGLAIMLVAYGYAKHSADRLGADGVFVSLDHFRI
ncbi:MAG: phosphoglycolate phosphatase [Alphaproteobacteria bacterium]|nr:phosphoglycolate phosphatase [Alphaproteobacteria bacterium]